MNQRPTSSSVPSCKRNHPFFLWFNTIFDCNIASCYIVIFHFKGLNLDENRKHGLFNQTNLPKVDKSFISNLIFKFSYNWNCQCTKDQAKFLSKETYQILLISIIIVGFNNNGCCLPSKQSYAAKFDATKGKNLQSPS